MYEDGIPRRGGGSVFLTIVVSALTSAAIFFGLREAELRGLLGEQGPSTVPSVAGMTVNQARELLSGRSLLLEIASQQSHATVAPGSIISQMPLAGSEAQAGKTVSVVISTGPTEVPDVAGLMAAEAATRLTAVKLVRASPDRQQPHATVGTGAVIATDPPAGTAVAEGDTVTLIVSTGPAGKPVPKVVGQSISRAKKALADAGFVVGKTRYGYSDRYDGSVVLAQTPEAEAMAAPGAAIDLVINEPDE